ncbi:hypothetical protein C8Q76DRAFT_636781 [Earliella scabrosa]|nr:hypothetical protein C8Q76DRAFT_636781 [Earliella scabrosa]
MILCTEYPAEPLFRHLPQELGRGIVEDLPLDSLLRLRPTCSLADEYVSVTLQRRLLVVLKSFVDDGPGLLSILEDYNAGISGRASLAFLFPEHVVGNVLDILVPQGLLEEMLNYLWNWEGYEVEEPEDVTSLLCVLGTAWMKQGEKEIRLHESAEDCSLLLASAQWNTALYNFVDTRGFTCGYPSLTSQGCALLNWAHLQRAREPTEAVLKELGEWKKEGWLMGLYQRDVSPNFACPGLQRRHPSCPRTRRSFGDRFCTTGALWPVRRARGPGGAHALFESWWVEWVRGGLPCSWSCARRIEGVWDTCWIASRTDQR